MTDEFDRPAVDMVRIKQFDAHRKAIADTLRLPLDADLVEEISFLRTLRESERARFMGGKTIDVSAYLTLSKVLGEITPTKPHRVVEIVFTDQVNPGDTPSPASDTPTQTTSDDKPARQTNSPQLRNSLKSCDGASTVG
jgi:hypothetical protein